MYQLLFYYVWKACLNMNILVYNLSSGNVLLSIYSWFKGKFSLHGLTVHTASRTTLNCIPRHSVGWWSLFSSPSIGILWRRRPVNDVVVGHQNDVKTRRNDVKNRQNDITNFYAICMPRRPIFCNVVGSTKSVVAFFKDPLHHPTWSRKCAYLPESCDYLRMEAQCCSNVS